MGILDSDFWEDPWEGIKNEVKDKPLEALGFLTGGSGTDPTGLSFLINWAADKGIQKLTSMTSGRSETEMQAEENAGISAAAKAASDQQALIDDYYGNLAGMRKKRTSRLNAFSGAMGLGDDEANRVLQPSGKGGGGFR